MSTHTLLVGMSPAETAHRAWLLETAREHDAGLAFLQIAEPSLTSELTRLADAGAERIVLVGVCSSRSGPGVSWLRRIASHWWQQYGPGAPEVATAAQFLAASDELPGLRDAARPITSGGAGLRSEAWERVPSHSRQVLVCRGPRCTAAGAEETVRGLVLGMAERGIGDDDVLVTNTGCQFPCNHAPVVSVQPDDVWYGRVDAAAADRIVEEHLVGGTPYEEVRLSRG